MEKGASNEELDAYIREESDGRPTGISVARYVAHFGSRGQDFANAINLGDLPQNVSEY